jgi:hypothetical protein
MAGSVGTDTQLNRKRALLYILPFVLLGIGNLLLLLGWGLRPLWAFLILPPILFVSVIGYIAFRTGLASDRLGEEDEPTSEKDVTVGKR